MLTQTRVRYSRCRALLILPCLQEACDWVQQQDEQSEHAVGLVQPLQDVSTQPQLAHGDGSLMDNERAKFGDFLNQYGLEVYSDGLCLARRSGVYFGVRRRRRTRCPGQPCSMEACLPSIGLYIPARWWSRGSRLSALRPGGCPALLLFLWLRCHRCSSPCLSG